MIKLSIVVVFYNEFDLLVDCIERLQADAPKHTEIIVVDNNFKEKETKEVLKEIKNIIYIRNKENLGYAKGANIGFRKARGKYLLVTTPDLRLIKGTVTKTMRFLEEHSKVGVVGCRVYSPGNIFHPSAFHHFPDFRTHLFEYNYLYYKLLTKNNPTYHPTMYSEEGHNKELRPQHIIGAYLLMRKRAAEEVEFFDERFFLYREETDFCRKLWEKGWEVAYVPVGGVTHISNPSRHVITQTHPHYQKSTYLFYKKYYGFLYTFFLWVSTVFSVLLSICLLFGIFMYKLLRKQRTRAGHQLKFYFNIFYWQVRYGLPTVFS